MRHKWTRLHPRQWPDIIVVTIKLGNYEFKDAGNMKELWQHQIGYYLILTISALPKKRWYLVNHATGELLLDMTFNSTKKKAPTKEANEILDKRLFGMKI